MYVKALRGWARGGGGSGNGARGWRPPLRDLVGGLGAGSAFGATSASCPLPRPAGAGRNRVPAAPSAPQWLRPRPAPRPAFRPPAPSPVTAAATAATRPPPQRLDICDGAFTFVIFVVAICTVIFTYVMFVVAICDAVALHLS